MNSGSEGGGATMDLAMDSAFGLDGGNFRFSDKEGVKSHELKAGPGELVLLEDMCN